MNYDLKTSSWTLQRQSELITLSVCLHSVFHINITVSADRLEQPPYNCQHKITGIMWLYSPAATVTGESSSSSLTRSSAPPSAFFVFYPKFSLLPKQKENMTWLCPNIQSDVTYIYTETIESVCTYSIFKMSYHDLSYVMRCCDYKHISIHMHITVLCLFTVCFSF